MHSIFPSVAEDARDVVTGAVALFLGGIFLQTAGWNWDWAQFDVVRVPLAWPGSVTVAPEIWFGVGIALYAAGLVLIYIGGKRLGASVSRPTAQASGTGSRPLLAAGLGASITGAAITTAAYIAKFRYGIDAVAGLTYGQIWNAAHFLLGLGGATVFAAGAVLYGLESGAGQRSE